MDIMSLFLRIFNVSVSASFLVLAIVLLRLIFKKAPKSLTVMLWALVAIRLLCPFTLESKLSLVPNRETIPTEILSIDPGKENTYSFDPIINPIYSERIGSDAESVSVNAFQFDVMYASIYWVFGVGVMLLYALLSYVRLRFKVKTAIPEKDNLWLCDEVKSPFILGIFRPKIYLPSDMDEGTRSLVLSHENAHLKRKDHLWKPLGFMLLCLHWFNPVMWLSYILLCRDIELACDERVIRDMESGDKKAYSEALLSCSMPSRMISACPVAFGEVGVKKRIKSVLSYKKPAFWLIVLTVLASIVVALCFMTDPKDKKGTLNGVDEISEPYFRMSNVIFDARSYTVYEGTSTTDNYYEAMIEDAFGYGEVQQLLNYLSLEKLDKGIVDPMIEPDFSGAIKIEKKNETPITVLFHDDFQKMYMYKGNEHYSLRSDDYAVLNVEYVRDFFEEKPYKSHDLVWEYNLASSAWGHSEMYVLIDEKYKISGEVKAEGVIEQFIDEETGLDGISWRPDIEESQDSYKIEIPVTRNGEVDLFTFTMNKVGKKALATYYSLRAEELIVGAFPSGYEFEIGRAERVGEDGIWKYQPMLSATWYYFTTFLLPGDYEIKKAEATSGKATVENRFYNDDSEKCVKWTPDDDTKDAELVITGIRNGREFDFKVNITYREKIAEDGSIIYKISPENCMLREEGTGTYTLCE